MTWTSFIDALDGCSSSKYGFEWRANKGVRGSGVLPSSVFVHNVLPVLPTPGLDMERAFALTYPW